MKFNSDNNGVEYFIHGDHELILIKTVDENEHTIEDGPVLCVEGLYGRLVAVRPNKQERQELEERGIYFPIAEELLSNLETAANEFEILKSLNNNSLLDKSIDINFVDKNKRNFLHFEAQYGGYEASKKLINLGIDLKAKDIYNLTALHWAAIKGHDLIVQELIEAGADVNAVNFNGDSSLGALFK